MVTLSSCLLPLLLAAMASVEAFAPIAVRTAACTSQRSAQQRAISTLRCSRLLAVAPDGEQESSSSKAGAEAEAAAEAAAESENAEEAAADATADEGSADAAADAKSEKDVLKEKIAALEVQLRDARGTLASTKDELADAGEKGYMLLAANFERYRLKARDDLDGQAGLGKVAMVREMLPFVEEFTALQATTESDADSADIHKFYAGIYKQLNTMLGAMKLEKIEAAEGDLFEYNLHTQIERRASETVPVGCVVEVKSVGYRIAEGVVRNAQVVVSSGKPVEAAKEEAEEEKAAEEEEASEKAETEAKKTKN